MICKLTLSIAKDFGAAGSLVDRAVSELALFNGAGHPELAPLRVAAAW